ncbi:polyketide synthase-related [Holotrichia oblita]|nr:polyketide synthase-related [Holotrichia oblita]
MAENGANIAINYLNDAVKAQAVKDEITVLGVRCEIYRCNVADFVETKQMVDTVHKDFGGFDILVNNAGITRDNLLALMSEQDFDAVISNNLKSAFNTIRHTCPYFIRARKGTIINIASIAGLMGNEGQANYSAAKAGMIALTKSVAREYGARGITCNAVAPGFIESDMTDKLSDDIKKRYIQSIPLKRAGSAVDVANAVVFLASNMASYISGEYALAASIQAMNDSGLKPADSLVNCVTNCSPKSLPESNSGNIVSYRLGVYFSSGIGGMTTFDNESQRLRTDGPLKVSPYFISSMIENMAAGMIAIRHNAKGPSLSAVTACATSTNTIGEAFRAIKHGYADAIIAGGSEATIHPLALSGFDNCMALTRRDDPSAASIPFDKRRDGFVMGEGAGALILEEYGHAKARGAKIYAEITGYGNTCDANHVTAPRPDGECASRSITLALDESGLDVSSLAAGSLYINAHGTSTALNDKAETLAIKRAIGGAEAGRALVSSIKSMIGHCLGAAGALEAIAAIMALKDGIVPPTIGYIQPDPDCDLDYVPNTARKANVDTALSLSFGFGGHNACLAFKAFKG